MKKLDRIKKILIQDIENTTDEQVIDNIYQTLHRNKFIIKLYDKVNRIWSHKEEASEIVDTIANTPGSFKEKMDFANNLGKDVFISLDKLTYSHKIQPFTNWFNGDNFAYKAFLNISKINKQGIGAGEIALTLMDSNIEHMGRKKGCSDIQIKNKFVEIKARNTSDSNGGRLHDQAKSMYDMQTIQNMFNTMGIYKDSITAKYYTQTIRPTLTISDRQMVAETVVKSLFKYSTNEDTLIDKIISGDANELEQEWGNASYRNYQNCTKFDSILFLDFHEQKSLHVTDFTQVTDKIRFGSVCLFGDPRAAMPQITIKRRAMDID